MLNKWEDGKVILSSEKMVWGVSLLTYTQSEEAVWIIDILHAPKGAGILALEVWQ